ncbi:DNA-binding response regulator [uncultured Variovorax sp.]|uniref:response regulator transcription factor n=1 Tax=uncultured Variovorax sp. TaxID=114708 RepID=UPI0025DE1192|nr:DNA-binding response regulator [uncultured Variovorax sp.]
MSYWSTTPPRRAHILVIDDNIEELQLLLGVLREAGHRISLAFDALEGYRRATALLPDLVLLDVHMGATDGFATCRLLKADRTTARIPVIFVTSSGSVEERLTGLREGAVDYILKPFEPAEVLARVEVHLALASCRDHAQACIDEADNALEQARGGPSSDHADRVLAQAVERMVRADLANVPALPVLAASVGTHEKRLSRVFKEQTGRTVFEFAREARLAEAQRLLAGSALSVEEVALAVGFSGAANFSTAFRERYGNTPTAFRQARIAPVAPPSVPSA